MSRSGSWFQVHSRRSSRMTPMRCAQTKKRAFWLQNWLRKRQGARVSRADHSADRTVPALADEVATPPYPAHWHVTGLTAPSPPSRTSRGRPGARRDPGSRGSLPQPPTRRLRVRSTSCHRRRPPRHAPVGLRRQGRSHSDDHSGCLGIGRGCSATRRGASRSSESADRNAPESGRSRGSLFISRVSTPCLQPRTDSNDLSSRLDAAPRRASKLRVLGPRPQDR